MAMSFDFKPITYNDITGRIRNGNKDFYSSIGGMIEGVGTGAKDIASAHTAEEERKKREEEEKKKWDHMLEQEAYQRNRDAINDARYFAEQQRIAAKENEERARREEGLKNFRAAMEGVYTPEYIESLGPAAQAHYKAMLASNDLEMNRWHMGAIDTLDYQKKGLDREYRENEPARIANKAIGELNKEGVSSGYVPRKVDDKRGYVVDVDATERHISLIDSQIEYLKRNLERLGDGYNTDSITKTISELEKQKAFLLGKIHPGKRTSSVSLDEIYANSLAPTPSF
jgi:hypothetical protein